MDWTAPGGTSESYFLRNFAAGGEGSGQRWGSLHGAGADPAVSHLCQRQRASIHLASSPEVRGVKLQFLTPGFLRSGAQGAAEPLEQLKSPGNNFLNCIHSHRCA